MLWALVVMSIIIPGCKCFFIVARSISVILYCLIPVWQQCNMERGEILLPKIATDYPNKLLPCLARYTVLSLPWHVLHNKPKYLLQGTSKNVSLFLPCEASALDERKIGRRRIAPPALPRVCQCQAGVTHTTGSQGSTSPMERGAWQRGCHLCAIQRVLRSVVCSCISHFSKWRVWLYFFSFRKAC